MKRILPIAVLLFGAWFLVAQVLNVAPASVFVLTGGTTNSTAGTAVDILKASRVTFMSVAKSTNNADTEVLTVRLQASVDSTNWFQISTNTLTLTGTTSTASRVAIDFADYRYFRINYIAYPGTNQVTLTNYFFIK